MSESQNLLTKSKKTFKYIARIATVCAVAVLMTLSTKQTTVHAGSKLTMQVDKVYCPPKGTKNIQMWASSYQDGTKHVVLYGRNSSGSWVVIAQACMENRSKGETSMLRLNDKNNDRTFYTNTSRPTGGDADYPDANISYPVNFNNYTAIKVSMLQGTYGGSQNGWGTYCHILDYEPNHTWNSGTVTKAATCAATGIKTYTCTVCKETKTETIPKSTTHTGTWQHVSGPTCTAAEVLKCSVCKATKNGAAAKGHSYTYMPDHKNSPF